MTEPFFPTYKEKYTRTPNVFFDEILAKATINEVRIIGYLIRNTLGYNRDSKWIGVTRSDLIKSGVSNSRLTDALKACEEKGWILTYMEGSIGSQKRYIFLNDELNQRIIEALNRKLITIEQLEYLNLAGVEKLLIDCGLLESSPETGELPKSENSQNSIPKREKEKRLPSPKTGDVKRPKKQTRQGMSTGLNTSISLNTNKDSINTSSRGDERYGKFWELFPD